MKIKSLHLKNFRLFEDLQIDFDDRLNVFIGANGAGKSTILYALSKLINPETAIGAWEDLTFFLSKEDVRDRKKKTGVELIVEKNKKSFAISNEADAVEDGLPLNISITVPSGNTSIVEFWDSIENEIGSKRTPQKNIPIILLWGDDSLIKKISSSNNQRNYSGKVFWGAFDSIESRFQEFVTWFEDEENYENQKRLDIDNQYRNPSLEVIRFAIESFLGLSMQQSFSGLKMRKRRLQDNGFSKGNIESDIVIQKKGKEFLIDQLSSGEKALLMLVFDIARRMAIANPKLAPREVCSLGEGIVMIDEIDLHLHPSWQREVLPALLKTFPKVQFIATTHSPLVLSKIPRHQIFMLEDGKLVKNTPPTEGRDANSILFQLFGVTERPAEFQEKLDRTLRLIDDEKIDEARTALLELKKLWGENDGEIVRAETLIELTEA